MEPYLLLPKFLLDTVTIFAAIAPDASYHTSVSGPAHFYVVKNSRRIWDVGGGDLSAFRVIYH